MISMSSIISALFFYTVALLVICVLRTFAPQLIGRGGTFILLLATVFATLRLILPLEIPVSRLVRSWTLLGTPLRILSTYPNIKSALVAVWVIVGLLIIIWDFFTIYRAIKTSRGYTPVEDDCVKKLVAQNSIAYPVVVTRDVDTPCVVGFVKPTIYLPVPDLSEHEVAIVLSHEVQHARGRDALLKLCFRGLLVVMWWNPFAHWFWFSLDDLLELRCDAKLTEHMSAWERYEYGQVLSRMAAKAVKKKRRSLLVVDELFTVGRNEFIKQRVRIILDGTGRPPRRASIAACCAFAFLFCMSYLVVFQPALAPAETDFQDSKKAYYEEAYDDHDIGDGPYDVVILKGSDGRYQLFVNYIFKGYLTEDEVNSDEYCHYRIFEEE